MIFYVIDREQNTATLTRRKVRFEEKDVSINLIHPELKLGAEYNILNCISFVILYLICIICSYFNVTSPGH